MYILPVDTFSGTPMLVRSSCVQAKASQKAVVVADARASGRYSRDDSDDEGHFQGTACASGTRVGSGSCWLVCPLKQYCLFYSVLVSDDRWGPNVLEISALCHVRCAAQIAPENNAARRMDCEPAQANHGKSQRIRRKQGQHQTTPVLSTTVYRQALH